MIFITVGTHEQSFERLIKLIDKMVEEKQITDKVIIQKGYTDYEPKNCEAYKLIGYDEMQQYIADARIVVTHGGPASFVAPLAIGKIPVVVPRKKEFGEHVNNHQVDFAREVEKRMNNIIVAETEEEIIDAIVNYDSRVASMAKSITSNNKKFNEELKKEIESIL